MSNHSLSSVPQQLFIATHQRSSTEEFIHQYLHHSTVGVKALPRSEFTQSILVSLPVKKDMLKTSHQKIQRFLHIRFVGALSWPNVWSLLTAAQLWQWDRLSQPVSKHRRDSLKPPLPPWQMWVWWFAERPGLHSRENKAHLRQGGTFKGNKGQKIASSISRRNLVMTELNHFLPHEGKCTEYDMVPLSPRLWSPRWFAGE